MTETSLPALLREPGGPNRATLLELLLDVFYVAAFAQLSTRLAHDLSWRGTAETVVLLLTVWWTWSDTALITDFFEPRQPVIQRVIVSGMFGVALMTAVIPTAFGQHGLVFVGAYLGINVVRGILLLSALRERRLQVRAARFLSWFVASGFLWLAGGFLDSDRRLMLWAGAVVIEYVAAAVRYPLPKLGRVPLDQYDRLSTHFGERHQQIVILAIGELVLAVTLLLTGLGFTIARVVVFIAAVTIALLLWKIFEFRAELFLEKAVHGFSRRAVRLAAYVYAAQVAGVVGTTAGVELVIREPFGTTRPGWVALLVGGSALFLPARLIFEHQFLGRTSRSRVGWLVVLIGVAPALELPSKLETVGPIDVEDQDDDRATVTVQVHGSGGTNTRTSAAQRTPGGSRPGETPAAGGCEKPTCRRSAASGQTPAVERHRARPVELVGRL